MELRGKTILIIGGSAGIGLAFAQQLCQKGNKVIIAGRDEDKLKNAIKSLPTGNYEVADVTSAGDVQRLQASIAKKYESLHMLINNAGKGNVYNLADGSDHFAKASAEIMTNYLGIVRLVDLFLPLLKQVPEGAIVNVSSVAAYVPSSSTPTYSASKAALHSYTLVLRHALGKETSIKVFHGERGMNPMDVAAEVMAGIEADRYEIRVGATEKVYRGFLASPEEAFSKRNP
jgi:uncharacterized oxidoreductase